MIAPLMQPMLIRARINFLTPMDSQIGCRLTQILLNAHETKLVAKILRILTNFATSFIVLFLFLGWMMMIEMKNE